MRLSPDQLLAELLQLPVDVRARLAESLLTSLDEDADVEQAWAIELERRMAALDSGETTARPAGEVFRDLRERLHAS